MASDTTTPNARVRVHTTRGWRDGKDLESELRRGRTSPSFVWVVLAPDDDEAARRVEQRLGLSSGTIAAAETRRLRHRLDLVDGVDIIAIAALGLEPGPRGAVQRGDVTCLVTDSCAVAIESGDAGVLSEAQEILESDAAHLELGSMAVLRAIAIATVERVEQLVIDLGESIAQLEQDVFSPRGITSVHEIHRLKRQVAEAHRGVVPLASSLRHLAAGAESTLPEPVQGTLLALTQAADRGIEQISSYDAALGNMLSAHLAVISVQQNSDMRRISAWAALVAVPTMAAGLYGMNFRHMPGLDWSWGFPVALAAMALGCAGLYRLLKRFKWF